MKTDSKDKRFHVLVQVNLDYLSSNGYFSKKPDMLSAHTVPDQFLHKKQTNTELAID